MIQRREARELVMKALYAHDVGKNDRRQAIEFILKPRFEGQIKNYKFAESLFNKTVRHQEELDDVIEQHIKNWRMERLTSVDKLILRAAICEFLYFPEIPTKVTINEAIEIAKKYSTPDSGKFVNGILDAALGRLNEQNKIEKTGRGLIESSSPK
jgi:N utilization substance protein B